jgi:hypothetical protein
MRVEELVLVDLGRHAPHRKPERADRVPDADELYLRPAGIFRQPLLLDRGVLGQRLRQQRTDRRGVVDAIPHVELLDRKRRADLEDAALADEARHAARRVAEFNKGRPEDDQLDRMGREALENLISTLPGMDLCEAKFDRREARNIYDIVGKLPKPIEPMTVVEFDWHEIDLRSKYPAQAKYLSQLAGVPIGRLWLMPDQRAQIRVDRRPPSPSTGFPTPVAAKAGAVSTHERLGPNDRKNLQD